MKPTGKCVSTSSYLFALIVGLLAYLESEGKKQTTVKNIVRIEAYENCRDRPTTEKYFQNHNHLENVKLERFKMDQFISGDFVVTRPMKSIISNVRIMKCESVDPASCEFVMNMKFSNACERIVERNKFYSPMMEAITPRIKCPVRKNVHHIRNATFSSVIDSPLLTLIPGGANYYWAMNYTFTAEGETEEAGCMYMMFKMYRVKIKS